jgi:membrane protease YdiL (CAAX protease family)
MNALKSFSRNQPILFVLILIIAWFVLGMVFIGISSSAIRKPFDDLTPNIMGRLAVTICLVLLVWRLGWFEVSGIVRLGSWQVWLLALGSLIYFSFASLYAFYGKAAFDFSILTRLPTSRIISLTQFVVALGEEILFRGLVLYVLARAWGSTTRGLIGSIVLASLLFAVMHMTHIFTNRLPSSAALFLALETFFVAIWWGALVIFGGSIWPAVMLHFVGNTAMILQGLETAMIEPELLAYQRLLWFSIVLGVIGIGLLVKVAPEKPARQTLEI